MDKRDGDFGRSIYFIGASSLSRAIYSENYCKRKRLLSRATPIPGLSFNNRTRNQLKVLKKLLVKGKLKEVSNIVIWHDVINNSISKHRSNNNTALDVSKLLQILLQFKNRIKCIIYTRRCGTPDIFEALVTTGILVLHTERHLSSKRNLRKPDYKEELREFYPKQHIELTFESLSPN